MRIRLLIILFFLLPIPLSAQIETPGAPLSLKYSLDHAAPAVLLPMVTEPSIGRFLEQQPNRMKSLVFAIPIPVNLNCLTDGRWDEMPDGSKVWRISVVSPEAYSLNLIFSTFNLPEGGRMFLYTPHYQIVRGAFTEENELPGGCLATIPLPGDTLTVEVNLPPSTKRLPDIKISQVGHDFRNFFGESTQLKSGSCNVDINCPAGADWQLEKRAVVKFIRGGVWLCTGTLINNTRNDGRPLLYTANHCIGLDWHAEQSVFYFRYEKPGCGSGSGSLQYSLSGSKLLATTNKLDFSLVELSSAPPKSYDPYYAGWDRKVVTYLDSVVCIHHPNGDVKKISKTFKRVVTGDFGGGFDTNTHWHISQWDLGTTEPGSSGSALWNRDHRIVGDLTGGDASCNYNFNDYFQKFSVSWDKYPDSTNQLKYWLDPAHTGVEILNGYDPYSGGKPLANFEIRPASIETGKKVYFTDKSTGSPTSWTWIIPGGIPERLTGSQPGPVKFPTSGQYSITLIVNNSLGSDSLRQTVRVFDHPGGSISETRTVPGHVVTLKDASSGNPVTINWMLPTADPVNYTGPGPVAVTLTRPGYYTTHQVVEFNEYSDSIIHYNRIWVIPETLTFRSVTINNVEPDEHTGFMTQGAQGYMPGSNSLGVTAFAEAFRNTGDTAFMITGMTLHLEKVSKWSSGYYLPVGIWNSQRQPVLRDSVLVSDLRQDSKVTVWFKSPVNFDTLNYAGFEIRPWDQGTFVSRMAIDRGNNGKSTAFAMKGNQWMPLTDLTGWRTSLDIQLETTYLINSYDDEISILPNGNDGRFTIDLGRLVYRTVQVDVFNLSGQKIQSTLENSGNRIELVINPPVSGVYVARMTVDDLSFARKVMVVRN